MEQDMCEESSEKSPVSEGAKPQLRTVDLNLW